MYKFGCIKLLMSITIEELITRYKIEDIIKEYVQISTQITQ